MKAVKAEFGLDWIEILASELTRVGFAPRPGEKPDVISHRYFNVLRRGISRKPRQVHRAPGFAPEAEHAAVVDAIEAKFANGHHLMPHLSRFVANPDYNDDLLNDWGIHHLHLGSKPHNEDRRFVERTKKLLFVRIDDAQAFFIKVARHKEWADDHFVQIIHSNWPASIAGRRIYGVPGATVTNDERNVLRKKRVNAFIEMPDGTVYAPLGGGMMSSGTSTEVVLISDRWLNRIDELERLLKANAAYCAECILKQGVEPADELLFRLVLDQGSLLAVERNSGARFTLLDGFPLL